MSISSLLFIGVAAVACCWAASAEQSSGAQADPAQAHKLEDRFKPVRSVDAGFLEELRKAQGDWLAEQEQYNRKWNRAFEEGKATGVWPEIYYLRPIGHGYKVLPSVLQKRFGQEDWIRLAFTVSDDKLIGAFDKSFVAALYCTAVTHFGKQGNRDALVWLFSRRCVDNIGGADIELELAYFQHDTLPDGITILFDAYDRTEDKEVKSVIESVMRRAFQASGVSADTPSSVVEKCRAWYRDNRTKIQPNPQYSMDAGFRVYHAVPLFIPKEAPRKD